MTIEKLKSGSYRIKQMVNGKTYRVTLDHKPKKAEAEALIQKAIQKPIKSTKHTLISACKAYNASKANILSPATIMGYESIIRNIPKRYDIPITQFDNPTLQSLVNEWSANCSPKTVGNRAGYVFTVLKFNDIDVKQPTTPMKQKETPYIPTEEEVKAVLSVLKGQYWIACMLGIMGLRRSEILALDIDDLSDDNILTINKAMVPTKDKEYVIKSTKTSASTREIPIPENLADAIRDQGYIYKGDAGGMLKNLTRAQKQLGIKHFSFHKLRHFFASFAMQNGYTQKQIQETGGWADGSRIMAITYQHAMKLKEAQRSMAQDISNLSTDYPRKK